MKIIALEGLDGAGKTTQAELTVNQLEKLGHPSCLYRYTSRDNPVGRLITRIYSADSKFGPKSLRESRYVQEALYAYSARLNFDKLNKLGKEVVIADRSMLTAFACHRDKLPPWYISLVEPKIIPDVVFYIEVDPTIGMKRVDERKRRWNDENLAFQQKLAEHYEQVMNGSKPHLLRKSKIARINGHREIQEVNREIVAGILEIIS